MYASMSRVLKHYRTYNGRYNPADIHPLTPFPAERKEPIRSLTDSRLTDKALLSSAALWYTFEAMSALNRPEEEADWQQFESMKRIAWKTGTSYGGRDAWAIGTTPRYVVGVWAGNASGEGRPGLTGVGNAAPVLFDLFSLLPGGEWFDLPYDETRPMMICRNSGHKASPYCEQTDTLYMPLSGNNTGICPYHKLVHLSADGRYRVNSSCESVDRMISRPWFVLPPAQEYYYRNYHIDYIPLPPVKPGCGQDLNRQIELIYPEHNAILYLPKGFSGKSEKFIFKAAHARRDATIYWHLDESYLGETTENHQISCSVGQRKTSPYPHRQRGEPEENTIRGQVKHPLSLDLDPNSQFASLDKETALPFLINRHGIFTKPVISCHTSPFRFSPQTLFLSIFPVRDNQRQARISMSRISQAYEADRVRMIKIIHLFPVRIFFPGTQ